MKEKKINPSVTGTEVHEDSAASMLSMATFLQREYNRYHHTYNEELEQYELLRDGDPKSAEIGCRLFQSPANGTLSEDPIRDKQFLFVAATTLATRFAIEGGLEPQTAYNNSDLFIQKVDKCKSVQEIYALHREMLLDFTVKMRQIHEVQRAASYNHEDGSKYSRPVLDSMEYIYYHLHEHITVPDLAGYVSLSPNYLSHIFHNETGVTIQEYIRRRRITAAKSMLLYSSYSQADIGEFLCFSSNSYFIKVFKELEGITPREYRETHFATHHNWADQQK